MLITSPRNAWPIWSPPPAAAGLTADLFGILAFDLSPVAPNLIVQGRKLSSSVGGPPLSLQLSLWPIF